MTDDGEPGVLSNVRAYVADVVGCAADQVGAVTKFEDGNRHDVYRVACPGSQGGIRDVVVRTAYGTGPAELEMSGREAKVMTAIGGVGAPSLLDYRPSSPWFATPTMCLEFVPGQRVDMAGAPADDVERLGAVLARVHGLPVGDLTDGSGTGGVLAYAEDRLASIMSTLVWVRDPLPAEISARITGAAETVRARWPAVRVSEAFAEDSALALLHGDVADGNVLWAEGPVLIDWEYARLGDPADDIANLLHQNGLSPALRAAFWRGYLGGGGARDPGIADRVTWWEPLTLLGSMLWWVERWVRSAEAALAGRHDPDASREAGYYREQALSRLHGLELLDGF